MILPHKGFEPKIDDSCFVSPSADIIGKVQIGKSSSVWFQVVIRGDVNHIKIGERTNIQDGSVLHCTRDKPPMKGSPLIIGDDVTIAHRVTLHGCTLKNRILIGMGSTILDGAVIDDDSIVAAGSLVTKDKVFPPKSLIQGSPAKFIRELNSNELAIISATAVNYVQDGELYNKEYTELFGDEDCGHDHSDGGSCSEESE